ncbi:4-aminobutyrate--2-oxoglutarate transaminase [Ammoniphilus sp. CFH 90114]|uniref:4-aminobutyrate--2-oxoglutarate transaminase n=1 Tax=Ammoniphilus sp. CFH 90114 TaxID=2493665 RepID=UPI00100F6B24|nr:4-aminobutyrate--2-oxoglutarate transaminase [Ammoniphilus sp. CFH 90114]RXT05223.1 4-aminobutyrate--2-oxoglutarate transaminase [Ammoniphilus sp. CFH 90114]
MGEIVLTGSVPGPRSEQLKIEREQAVPQALANTTSIFAKKADGALLTDIDGNTYIDFAGAIGALNVGHRPPKVVESVKEQLDSFIHTSFHVVMYESYIKLAQQLNELVPGSSPKKTALFNSGAEGVENAVKIARYYTGRRGIVSFDRGFHGRTHLTMTLTSKVKPYKFGFGPLATDTYRMPYPYYYREENPRPEADREALRQFERLFSMEIAPEDIAAVIMEPVQGEGGFVIPSKEFVQGVKRICEEHGILFIADEIQTGFGRTGKMFAVEHFDIEPDLIVMSKSLAAGVPLSAVTGRADIMDSLKKKELGGTLGGSPLACAAALAVIEMMKEENLLDRAQVIGRRISENLERLADTCPSIGEVRSLGAMCAVEFVRDRSTKEPDAELPQRIAKMCLERGLIVLTAGWYGNVIRFLTPLVITDEQLEEGLQIFNDVVQECEKGVFVK